MGLKDFFSLSRKPEDVLRTPYGNFNLAKESDRKRIQKMVLELHRTTDALTRKDIQDWRNAWQLAINVDSPIAKSSLAPTLVNILSTIPIFAYDAGT